MCKFYNIYLNIFTEEISQTFLFLQEVGNDTAEEECIKPQEPSHNREQVY